MKINKCVLFIMLVFISTNNLFSQTILVSGDINSNTTWDADTVKISGDINVLPGIVLTIEPGTYIESQGYHRINVAGSIKAIGTLADTIVFTVNDTTNFWQDEYSRAGSWAGFYFNDSTSLSDTSIFEYCKLQYGKKCGSAIDDNKGGIIKAIQYGTLIIRNSYLLCNMAINHEYLAAKGNVAMGGAVYCNNVNSIIIDKNRFERNRSFNEGGAVYIGEGCQSDISNNTFIGNKAWNSKIISGFLVSWGSGAAIETYGYDDPSPKISGNYCFNNYTIEGIISSCNQEGLIFNNLLCNNFGIGITAEYFFSMVRIFNNTIINNDSHFGGIFLYSFAKVYNNIVWGNIDFQGAETDQIQKLNADGKYVYPVLFNNCVQYGNGGANSISTNPEFINPTEGFGIEYNGASANWALTDVSPCINSGTADTTGLFIPEFDISGNPRLYGVRVEMGCYENQSVLTNNSNEITDEHTNCVFPNPGINRLNLETSETGANFEVITLSGQVVISETTIAGLNSFNTESFVSGIYFFRLINKKNEVLVSGKWIKK